jgi:copper(I)-binding protein
MKRTAFALLLVLLAALGTAGCGGDEGSEGGSGGIDLSDAWARSPAPDMGAAYLSIENTGDQADTLTAVSADVEGTVELHETSMVDGQAEMKPVEGGLEIPAGETVVLEPGGYHVMMTDLATPLEVGDTVAVTLTFQEAGDLTVEAKVETFVEEDMGGSMESPSESM